MSKFDLYGHIKACLKYRFWRYPPYKAVEEAARVEEPVYKKDGTLAKVPRVRYRCAKCLNLVPKTEIQIDHIDPVIDPKKGRETIEILINRQFTDKLQVLCKPCHKAKSAEERKIAAEYRKKRKEAEKDG
jgi:5-methylcytosine-specific restriction endonuclease McrA